MEAVSVMWIDSKAYPLQRPCSRSGSSWNACNMATKALSCQSQGMRSNVVKSRTMRDRLLVWSSNSHGIPEESGRRELSNSGREMVKSHLRRIHEAGVIACLRTESPELALESARAALDNNVTVLEVTMTTPAATEVIEILVGEYPAALIGAGTVLSWKEAEKALNAGAKFLLSPVTIKEVVVKSRDDSVLFIPGAMTPTEVAVAYSWGAEAVKLFPVGVAGGLGLVNALKRSLPQIPLVVSSGVTLDMLEQYLNAGAIAAVLSDAIFDKTAMSSRDLAMIEARARAVTAKASCILGTSKCNIR